jgi:hypothetical protein
MTRRPARKTSYLRMREITRLDHGPASSHARSEPGRSCGVRNVCESRDAAPCPHPAVTVSRGYPTYPPRRAARAHGADRPRRVGRRVGTRWGSWALGCAPPGLRGGRGPQRNGKKRARRGRARTTGALDCAFSWDTLPSTVLAATGTRAIADMMSKREGGWKWEELVGCEIHNHRLVFILVSFIVLQQPYRADPIPARARAGATHRAPTHPAGRKRYSPRIHIHGRTTTSTPLWRWSQPCVPLRVPIDILKEETTFIPYPPVPAGYPSTLPIGLVRSPARS